VELPPTDRDSLRLAIGRDTDLLFHRGRYSGWILGSPIAHLKIPICVRRYVRYELVSKPSMEGRRVLSRAVSSAPRGRSRS
jgi:hypothetical protein